MLILVCGGRDYQNVSAVNHALGALHARRTITLIIEGGQTGADTLAGEWADRNGVERKTEAAKWEEYGRVAGPMRNAAMLKLLPDGVVAFPGGIGTANMVKQATAAGLKVWRPFG